MRKKKQWFDDFLYLDLSFRYGFLPGGPASCFLGEPVGWPTLAHCKTGAAQHSSEPDCGQKHSAGSYTSWAQPMGYSPGENWRTQLLSNIVLVIVLWWRGYQLNVCCHSGKIHNTANIHVLQIDTLFFFLHYTFCLQLSVGAVQSHGLQRPIRSNRSFKGCLENLLYNDLSLVNLAKQNNHQVTVMVSSYTSVCLSIHL